MPFVVDKCQVQKLGFCAVFKVAFSGTFVKTD